MVRSYSRLGVAAVLAGLIHASATCVRNTDCTANAWCNDLGYDAWCSAQGAAGACPSPMCTQSGAVVATTVASTASSSASPASTSSGASATSTTKPPTTAAPVSTSAKATAAPATTSTKSATTSTFLAKTTAAGAGTQVVLPSPRRVLYIDYRDINWSSPTSTVTAAVDAGYNVIVLAFLLSSSAADMAGAWQGAGAAAQIAAVSYAHSKGAVVMISAAGSTDQPWTTFASGAGYGTYAGQWAQSNNLDGVDFDVENLAPGFIAGSFSGTQFAQYLADASIAAKKFVKFVSHAPQAPYFGAVGSSTMWPGTSGGYSSVEALANGAIDFYNVQFYNQGATCYTTYDGLFTSSASDCSVFPGTSVQEIKGYGIPLSKLTVTKYLLTADGGNGYVSATALNRLLAQGEADTTNPYTGGVSCWAYAASSSKSWIAAVCNGGAC